MSLSSPTSSPGESRTDFRPDSEETTFEKEAVFLSPPSPHKGWDLPPVIFFHFSTEKETHEYLYLISYDEKPHLITATKEGALQVIKEIKAEKMVTMNEQRGVTYVYPKWTGPVVRIFAHTDHGRILVSSIGYQAIPYRRI